MQKCEMPPAFGRAFLLVPSGWNLVGFGVGGGGCGGDGGLVGGRRRGLVGIWRYERGLVACRGRLDARMTTRGCLDEIARGRFRQIDAVVLKRVVAAASGRGLRGRWHMQPELR